MARDSNVTLWLVRLHLARNDDFPEGSDRHGYEIIAPLDASGYIDAKTWQAVRDRCRVRRFWDDDEDDLGHLVRSARGNWGFDYDIAGDEGLEAGYRLGQHAFVLGQYLTIGDEDGRENTFRIVSVEPIHQAPKG